MHAYLSVLYLASNTLTELEYCVLFSSLCVTVTELTAATTISRATVAAAVTVIAR